MEQGLQPLLRGLLMERMKRLKQEAKQLLSRCLSMRSRLMGAGTLSRATRASWMMMKTYRMNMMTLIKAHLLIMMIRMEVM